MPERPRGPGAVYAVVTVLLLVLVATLALTTRQPPPPTIAEFAPQAVENITDAPDDQSSSSGRAGGLGGAGGETPTPPPVDAPVIEQARVRKCVGDPPRQIEDPQSPPCVPYWTGNNGGVTAPGVTQNEIRVAMRNSAFPVADTFARFFNRRFELYGRKIFLYQYKPHGTESNKASTEQQKATAVEVHEKGNVFATLPSSEGGGFDYAAELARRKVITVSDRPNASEDTLAKNSPYMWQYPMGAHEEFRQLGQWACARLSGRNAIHAGDVEMRTKQRKFGMIVVIEREAMSISGEPLRTALRACNEVIQHDITTYDVNDKQSATNALLQMRNKGVTSVFCLCHVVGTGMFGQAASSQGYAPEWIATTYNLMDDTTQILKWLPANMRANLFGLTVEPREIPVLDEPSTWARREADPAYVEPGDSQQVLIANSLYRALLLLASGFQMAGPNLTPETFAGALHKTAFPNAPHPNIPGAVGFTTHDHSMTEDATEWYWSESHRGPYTDTPAGAICYVGGGVRATSWSAGGDEQFFRLPCP